MTAGIGLESYLFFLDTKAKFGLKSQSMFETRTDEDENGFLTNTLCVLLQIRQQAFEIMSDLGHQDSAPQTSAIPKRIFQLRPWDVRRLVAENRSLIMSGAGFASGLSAE